MDKLGVVIDTEKEKTASPEDKTKCPSCKATIDTWGYCNNCGTKPFEKRDSNG